MGKDSNFGVITNELNFIFFCLVAAFNLILRGNNKVPYSTHELEGTETSSFITILLVIVMLSSLENWLLLTGLRVSY